MVINVIIDNIQNFGKNISKWISLFSEIFFNLYHVT